MVRILVVDDTQDIRLLLVRVLKRAGHEVIEANDGAVVQSLVLDALPDVIILDLMMPGMDGWETLKRLKSDAGSRNVPVIISSAIKDQENIDRAFMMGAVDYLPKPWTADDLLERVRLASTIHSKSA